MSIEGINQLPLPVRFCLVRKILHYLIGRVAVGCRDINIPLFTLLILPIDFRLSGLEFTAIHSNLHGFQIENVRMFGGMIQIYEN
ncbi:hypothetical protein D3C73_1239190 [compost metagenome]